MPAERERAADLRLAFGKGALAEARRLLHRAMADRQADQIDLYAAICLLLIRSEENAAAAVLDPR
jgi:hypothetical protein